MLATKWTIDFLNEEIPRLYGLEKEETDYAADIAATETDLSENSKYIEAKRRATQLRNQRTRLEKILDSYKDPDRTNQYNQVDLEAITRKKTEEITFGSIVTINVPDLVDKGINETFTFQIVDEILAQEFSSDDDIEYVIPENTLAKSVMNRSVGTRNLVKVPRGTIEIKIVDVQFGGYLHEDVKKSNPRKRKYTRKAKSTAKRKPAKKTTSKRKTTKRKSKTR